MTDFDREVLDAISSLVTSNDIISDSMIYKVIVGKTNSPFKPSRIQKQKVQASMEKCRNCYMTLDLSENFNASCQEEHKGEFYIEEALISYRKITHKLSTTKNMQNYYQFLSLPPLLNIAKSFGKINRIPINLIDTPVNKFDSTLAMQSFLLREIEEMKKKDFEEVKIPLKIIYNCYFNNMNDPQSADSNTEQSLSAIRTQTNRIRNYLVKMLNWWKDNNYIGSYDIDSKDLKELTIFNTVENNS